MPDLPPRTRVAIPAVQTRRGSRVGSLDDVGTLVINRLASLKGCPVPRDVAPAYCSHRFTFSRLMPEDTQRTEFGSGTCRSIARLCRPVPASAGYHVPIPR